MGILLQTKCAEWTKDGITNVGPFLVDERELDVDGAIGVFARLTATALTPICIMKYDTVEHGRDGTVQVCSIEYVGPMPPRNVSAIPSRPAGFVYEFMHASPGQATSIADMQSIADFHLFTGVVAAYIVAYPWLRSAEVTRLVDETEKTFAPTAQ